jgi:hypothetical protein
MPNTIQLGEYSTSSGTGGTSHSCYATFNRWNDERNVNVNRNDNDWDDDWSFAGVPKFFSFLTHRFGGRVFGALFVLLFVTRSENPGK